LRILVGTMLACALAAACAAAPEAPIPPPASVHSDGVKAWLNQYIKADGWIVFAFDQSAVSLGSPQGVAVLSDNTLQADVRREYFSVIIFGEFASRSNLQTWNVDCKSGKIRTTSMTVYALNNLQGDHETRELSDAPWHDVAANSVDEVARDRICRAPTEGSEIKKS
jgi:hypothetical protein